MATVELEISFPWYARALLVVMGWAAVCIGPFLTEEQADRVAGKWGDWYCGLIFGSDD